MSARLPRSSGLLRWEDASEETDGKNSGKGAPSTTVWQHAARYREETAHPASNGCGDCDLGSDVRAGSGNRTGTLKGAYASAPVSARFGETVRIHGILLERRRF